MGHWRKPFPPKPVRKTVVDKPSPIAEVTALLRGIFHVDWLPFDEKHSAVRRRFSGRKQEN